jgi:hypothetical protein
LRTDLNIIEKFIISSWDFPQIKIVPPNFS